MYSSSCGRLLLLYCIAGNAGTGCRVHDPRSLVYPSDRVVCEGLVVLPNWFIVESCGIPFLIDLYSHVRGIIATRLVRIALDPLYVVAQATLLV